MKGNEMNRKLEFYKDNNKSIHVSCGSGRFYNGAILYINLEKDLLVLVDIKIGEVPILFEEIINVEPFREKEE